MDASEAWRIGNDAAAVEEEEEVNLRGEDRGNAAKCGTPIEGALGGSGDPSALAGTGAIAVTPGVSAQATPANARGVTRAPLCSSSRR